MFSAERLPDGVTVHHKRGFGLFVQIKAEMKLRQTWTFLSPVAGVFKNSYNSLPNERLAIVIEELTFQIWKTNLDNFLAASGYQQRRTVLLLWIMDLTVLPTSNYCSKSHPGTVPPPYYRSHPSVTKGRNASHVPSYSASHRQWIWVCAWFKNNLRAQ